VTFAHQNLTSWANVEQVTRQSVTPKKSTFAHQRWVMGKRQRLA
jgi:hypothetical protein